MRRTLVVDDEPKILRLVSNLLRESGYSVETGADLATARGLLDAEMYDLLVSDIRLPDGSGVDLLDYARQVSPGTQAILITAHGTISEAVRAMKLGATDYIQKPFDMETLRVLVERALDSTGLREEIRRLRSDRDREGGDRALVGDGAALSAVKDLIRKVAPTPSTVLIRGESGSGKELAAEEIHRLGTTPKGPLVKVNCPAIPIELIESELFGHVRGAFTGAHESRKGWFELADGGTLFLDEVADIPPQLQVKLLRVLEENRIYRVGSRRPVVVNARLIAATNADLPQRVADGRLREELYYRLNVFPIIMPPLRERLDDLGALVDELLKRIAVRLGRPRPRYDPSLIEVLGNYTWPGNVRELRNVLERAMVLAGTDDIAVKYLPSEIRVDHLPDREPEGDFGHRLESFKVRLLLDALQESGWVKQAAAERLGLSPRAMSHYLARYGLEKYRDGESRDS